ncbi:MAG: hypothetical protein RIE73_25810 [Coleofasciculus sp. C1-SOL-03]
MNQPKNLGLENSNYSLIVNHSPKLSPESDKLSTETSGSGISPESSKPSVTSALGIPPEKPKLSMTEKFGFNNQLSIVDPHRRNGLILYKRYHAEFAGPGAAVGGIFDHDCQQVIPVGDMRLLTPESADERQRACLIRRQWAQLTRQITGHPTPAKRAQKILSQFEGFFDAETIAKIPDEAFALLVGVFPHTVQMIRESSGK